MNVHSAIVPQDSSMPAKSTRKTTPTMKAIKKSTAMSSKPPRVLDVRKNISVPIDNKDWTANFITLKTRSIKCLPSSSFPNKPVNQLANFSAPVRQVTLSWNHRIRNTRNVRKVARPGRKNIKAHPQQMHETSRKCSPLDKNCFIESFKEDQNLLDDIIVSCIMFWNVSLFWKCDELDLPMEICLIIGWTLFDFDIITLSVSVNMKFPSASFVNSCA